VVTANAQALRHCLLVSGSIVGDFEMRAVSELLYGMLHAEAPSFVAERALTKTPCSVSHEQLLVADVTGSDEMTARDLRAKICATGATEPQDRGVHHLPDQGCHGDRRPRAGVSAAGAPRLGGAARCAPERGKIQDDIVRVLSAEPPAVWRGRGER
jgi:hypothetical protein